MQAVILAAGFGSRLAQVTGGLPKCLLPIGGRPLIEHQLDALADAGIGKVMVVVGHKADEVRKVLGNRVEYIENSRYDETNSLYSLWLTRDWVKESFVLLNCDLLFHSEILDRLLAKEKTGLVFDSTSSRSKEQTKVAVHEGKLTDLGKDLAPELTRGESLGMIYFEAKAIHPLMARANALIENGAERSWVIEAVRSVCSEVEMQALNVAGLPWVEIDFPSDFERAKREVWPAIEKSRWKRRVGWKRLRYVLLALLMAAIAGAGLYIGSTSRTDPVKISWTSEAMQNATTVYLQLPKGRQTWWHSPEGEPLEVALDGPTPVRVEVRLLMEPGTEEPGEYVIQISLDGKPLTWRSFHATPDPDVSIPDAVVGDRDRVKFDLPSGRHLVAIELIAGTSKRFLARVRYPETDSPEDNSQ